MYKTLKIPFKHIIKEQTINVILEDMITRTTIIVKHFYYFIKLYSLFCFENNKFNLIFDKSTIRYIFTLISTIKSKNTVKFENKYIKKFNTEIFSKIKINKVSRDGLTNVLAYETDIIITCIENNIKNNFVRHFNKYINIVFDIKNKIADTTDIAEKRLLWANLRKIKDDILSFTKYKSDVQYHNFIKNQQKYLFNKTIDDENIYPILYNVKSNPQKYIYTFYKILAKFELLNKNIVDDNKKIKMFSMLPLRTSLIPKHITIDSEILIQNFKRTIKDNLHKFPKEIRNIEDLRRNFTEHQDVLWNIFFKLDKKINKDYKFDYLLRTDNNACSLQFAIKTEEKKQRFKKGVNKKLNDKTKNKVVKGNKNVKYIDDILKNNKFALKNKNIVCIDPNKGDLIYSGTYKDDEFVSFRYTNNQRRKEKKTKKYNNIRNKILNKGEVLVNGKKEQIKKYNVEKSKYKKQCVGNKETVKYIEEMEKIDKIIKEHYENSIYRKLNMNSYINTQRSESRMMQNFKSKMGSEKDTVVIIGDNGLKDVVIKGLETTLSKGIINMFIKNKYETYIIDEFRTSLLCNGCENKLSKFLDVQSKKPWSKDKVYKSNGILRCQSSTQLCNVIHNRDKNAVKNMLKLVDNYVENRNRKLRYSREFSF